MNISSDTSSSPHVLYSVLYFPSITRGHCHIPLKAEPDQCTSTNYGVVCTEYSTHRHCPPVFQDDPFPPVHPKTRKR
jgi:hypothetical protein